MPRLDRTGPLGYGPRTGRMGRGYYSYGSGFGQLLPAQSGALLPPRLPTATTATRTTATTTGGGTPIDAATFRHIQAVMAQRVSTGIVATPITALKLLTPLKTATTPAKSVDIKMDPAASAAWTGPSVGSKVLPSGGGGGGGNGGVPADQFAEACAAAGGSVVGPQLCKLADGAIVTVDAQGNAVCTNDVGKCAGPGAGVAGKAGGNALLIGAAAIAALMFLR